MTPQEDRKKIDEMLKEYRKKYNADYYCVLLTPSEGEKVRLYGSHHVHQAEGGEIGNTIGTVVEREVLLKPSEEK